VRLTKEAFLALTDVNHRLRCQTIPQAPLKGIDRPVELVRLEWRDRKVYPASVRLETGQELELPDQDIISFGRLRESEGLPGNDIVLQCREERETMQISRWHFELRRQPGGFVIRSISDASTVLNGQPLSKGQELPLRAGDCVRVGNILSLHFANASLPDSPGGGQTVLKSELHSGKPDSARRPDRTPADSGQPSGARYSKET
jgi:hypothetical protein